MKVQIGLTLSLLVCSVVSRLHHRETPHPHHPAVPDYRDVINDTDTQYPYANEVTTFPEVSNRGGIFVENVSYPNDIGGHHGTKTDLPLDKVDSINDRGSSEFTSARRCNTDLIRAKMYTCFDIFSAKSSESKGSHQESVSSSQDLLDFCELRTDFASCLKEKSFKCSTEQKNVLWRGLNLDTILDSLNVICANISYYKEKIECQVQHEKDICHRDYPPNFEIMGNTEHDNEEDFENYKQKLCKDYQDYLKCAIQVWDSHCNKGAKDLLTDYNCALAKSTCTEEDLYHICVTGRESGKTRDMPVADRRNQHLRDLSMNHDRNRTEIHHGQNDDHHGRNDNHGHGDYHDEDHEHRSEACSTLTSFLATFAMLSAGALLNV